LKSLPFSWKKVREGSRHTATLLFLFPTQTEPSSLETPTRLIILLLNEEAFMGQGSRASSLPCLIPPLSREGRQSLPDALQWACDSSGTERNHRAPPLPLLGAELEPNSSRFLFRLPPFLKIGPSQRWEPQWKRNSFGTFTIH